MPTLTQTKISEQYVGRLVTVVPKPGDKFSNSFIGLVKDVVLVKKSYKLVVVDDAYNEHTVYVYQTVG